MLRGAVTADQHRRKGGLCPHRRRPGDAWLDRELRQALGVALTDPYDSGASLSRTAARGLLDAELDTAGNR